MKIGVLQFSFGVSLVCHVAAFSLAGYWGLLVTHPSALPSEDLPLTMTLLSAPETSAVQSAPGAPAVPTAPTVEIVPSLPKVKPSLTVPVEVPSEPDGALPEPTELLPRPPSPTIAVTVAAMPPVADSVGGVSLQPPELTGTPSQVRSVDRTGANYRRNPKPAYPLVARRRHQEGTVLLSVQVTSQGRANRVMLKQSSGFPLLDEAALQTVREWEFEPARIGAVAVESAIEVPVRFRLGD